METDAHEVLRSLPETRDLVSDEPCATYDSLRVLMNDARTPDELHTVLVAALESVECLERERRRADRLERIARIGQAITVNLRLEDLMQCAVDSIHDLLGYPYVSITLVDERDEERMTLTCVTGAASTAISRCSVRMGEGIVGCAARERRSILVEDVRDDPRYLPVPGMESLRSELAVPLLWGDRLFGILNAESQERLTEDDHNSLRIIAGQLAIAVYNARIHESARRSLEEVRHLYQTNRRLGAALDPEEVTRAYLEQVAIGTPWLCSIALYEWDGEGGRCAVVVRGRCRPEDGVAIVEERYPYSRDGLDRPMDEGHTIAIRDTANDPRVSDDLRRLQAESGRPALALIPLTVRGTRIGWVALSHTEPHEWKPEELKPFEATAYLLSSALDNRSQRRLLLERNRRIVALEERHRIARELHDSVTQWIFSITLIAQSLKGAWRRDPEEGERRAERLLSLSQSALAEMRMLLADWRTEKEAPTGATSTPGLLHVRREGLAPALRAYLSVMDFNGIRVRLDGEGYERQATEHEEALFRITQEALHNAAKHARAEEAIVRLRCDERHATVDVTDNGAGFSTDTGWTRRSDDAASGGLGLVTMRERAEALGGSLIVRSKPGYGTTVVGSVPRKDFASG